MNESGVLNLLKSHGDELHALLVRLTLKSDVAQDLLQELFIKLAYSREFANADNARAYAYRVAINLGLGWRRAMYRHGQPQALKEDRPANHAVSALDLLIRDEETHEVLDALNHVSKLSREAFVLRHIQQEPYEQIGHILGKSTDQARALAHSAARQIRQWLENTTEPVKKEVPYDAPR